MTDPKTTTNGPGAFDAPVVTDVRRRDGQIIAAVSHGAVDALVSAPVHVSQHEIDAALSVVPPALESRLANVDLSGGSEATGGIEADAAEDGLAHHLDAALAKAEDPAARYHIRQALQHQLVTEASSDR